MDYEGQICRPPMERPSFMLGTVVGCEYNRCKFCMLFKHLRYRQLPLEQIEQELRRVQGLGGNPEQVFLGDGNAFGMETSRLLHIVRSVFYHFPGCRMVNMDATVTDIENKSDEELRALAQAGVNRLYLGIESGLDDVLAFMHKDHDLARAYRAIERIQKAGLSFNAHMMTGVSGAGRGLENAQQLAAFYNRTRPDRIINFSLFLHRSAPLYRDIQAGRFTPADEAENLREARRLLELLDVDCQYDGFHDQLGLRVWGELPRDRRAMLRKLDDSLTAYGEGEPVFSYVD